MITFHIPIDLCFRCFHLARRNPVLRTVIQYSRRLTGRVWNAVHPAWIHIALKLVTSKWPLLLLSLSQNSLLRLHGNARSIIFSLLILSQLLVLIEILPLLNVFSIDFELFHLIPLLFCRSKRNFVYLSQFVVNTICIILWLRIGLFNRYVIYRVLKIVKLWLKYLLILLLLLRCRLLEQFIVLCSDLHELIFGVGWGLFFEFYLLGAWLLSWLLINLFLGSRKVKWCRLRQRKGFIKNQIFWLLLILNFWQISFWKRCCIVLYLLNFLFIQFWISDIKISNIFETWCFNLLIRFLFLINSKHIWLFLLIHELVWISYSYNFVFYNRIFILFFIYVKKHGRRNLLGIS